MGSKGWKWTEDGFTCVKCNRYVSYKDMPNSMGLVCECSTAVPTLRDQFAMAALTGLLAYQGPVTEPNDTKYVYKYADAMLAARADGADAT